MNHKLSCPKQLLPEKLCNPLLFNLASVRMRVTFKKQDVTVAVVQILKTSSSL